MFSRFTSRVGEGLRTGAWVGWTEWPVTAIRGTPEGSHWQAGRPSTIRATDQVPLGDKLEVWRGEWLARPEGVDHRRSPLTAWARGTPAFAYCAAAYVSDVPIRVIAGLPKPSRDFCLSFSRPEAQSRELLQAIANLKVQAAIDLMNRPGSGEAPSHATRMVRALESTLKDITGRSFVFRVTSRPTASLGSSGEKPGSPLTCCRTDSGPLSAGSCTPWS